MMPRDTPRYENHVIAGFLDRFIRLDGTMTSDTQCAYALAIAFGLLDGEPVRKVKAGNCLPAWCANPAAR